MLVLPRVAKGMAAGSATGERVVSMGLAAGGGGRKSAISKWAERAEQLSTAALHPAIHPPYLVGDVSGLKTSS